MPTYGEDLVSKLIQKLPEKQYFGIAEYAIPTRDAYANPDFVIVSAALGVVVLEVKDYVEILPGSTRDKLLVRRRDGQILQEENPVAIARKYALNVVREFQRVESLLNWYDGKLKLAFPWCEAVALPNIPQQTVEWIEETGFWAKGRVLGKEMLTEANFATALRNLPWAWELQSPLDLRILDGIRGALNPKLIVRDPDSEKPLGIVTIAQEREAYRLSELLSDEANDVIQKTSVRLVRGVAGSGKSLVLARRAEFLAEQHPDRRILVVAFNKDLIHDLSRRIRQVGQIEITNFHKLCRDIMGSMWREPFKIEGWVVNRFGERVAEAGLVAEYVAEEIEWREETDLYDPETYLKTVREGRQRPLNQSKRQLINEIFDSYMRETHQYNRIDYAMVSKRTLELVQQPEHPYRHAYDITLIDEAQDFAPSWISVVKEITKPTGLIFMCDDPTQALFPSFSWRRKGIDVTGHTRVLKIPFRNTRQITMAAYSLIEANQKLQNSEDIAKPILEGVELRDGEKPSLLFCRDQHEESRLIDQIIRAASAVKVGKIAILCHSPKHIKLYKSYESSHDIYVAPFKKMKGLEFHLVILPGLHSSFENYTEPEAMMEKRRHIYTAMTRAREYLVMTCQGVLPPALEPILPFMQTQLPSEYLYASNANEM